MRVRTVQVSFLIVLLCGTAFLPFASSASQSSPVSSKTITGAAIPLPADVEQSSLDDLNELTDNHPVSPKTNAFLLMTKEKTWVVATDTEPKAGIATVEGTAFSVSSDGDSFSGVLFSTDVSIRTSGKSASVAEVRDNPNQYAFDLVEINANYRQIAYSVDSSDAVEPMQTETGVLTTGQFFGDLFDQPPGQIARWSTLNLSSGEFGESRSAEKASRMLASGDQLLVHGWSQQFSMDDSATVTAIVLTRSPGSVPEAASEDNEPLLYLVNAEPKAKQISNVQTIHENGEELVGESVTVNAQVVGTKTSTKEFLLSVAQCAPESVAVPVSPGCVPVTTDNVVHSGVLYSGNPTSSTDFVGFVGLSNHRQNTVTEPIYGDYQVTGRVVSSSQIDPTLPEGYAVVVYSMERESSLSISPTSKVTKLQEEIDSALQRQLKDRDPATTTSSQTETERHQTESEASTDTATRSTGTSEMAVSNETESSQMESNRPTVNPTTVEEGFGEIEAPVPGFGVLSAFVAFLIVALRVRKSNL